MKSPRNPEDVYRGKPDVGPLFEQVFVGSATPNGDCPEICQQLGDGVPHRTSGDGHPRPQAHARRTDRATSHAAAASVKGIGQTQENILALLKAFPRGLTDEQLIYFYRETQKVNIKFWNATDSGIRSRRAELVRARLVEDSGATAKISTGRQATVWRLK